MRRAARVAGKSRGGMKIPGIVRGWKNERFIPEKKQGCCK
jgi:hypothetical protein